MLVTGSAISVTVGREVRGEVLEEKESIVKDLAYKPTSRLGEWGKDSKGPGSP